jgi:hypothetical protein
MILEDDEVVGEDAQDEDGGEELDGSNAGLGDTEDCAAESHCWRTKSMGRGEVDVELKGRTICR